MPQTQQKRDLSMYAGFAAVFIWSIGPAFNRSLTETLSTFTTGAVMNLGGGLIMLIQRLRTAPFGPVRKSNPRYWLLCGVTYIVYMLSANASAGLAPNRETAIITGLLRSLWPLLALVLTIPINKAKARPALALAVAVSFAGILLANYSGSVLSVFQNIRAALLPMGLALCASICWSLHSNFLPLTVTDEKGDYLPILTLITGAIQLVFAVALGETVNAFGWQQLGEVFFMVVLSTFAGNSLWNYAMKGKGRMAALLASNLMPVFATVCSTLLLGLKLTFPVVAGSVLLVIGTLWSERCFYADEKQEG